MQTETKVGWMLIADLHAKKETLSRNAATYTWVEKEFNIIKPTHVIFLGDTTSNREHISWDTLHEVTGLIGRMAAASWKPTVHLLVGNHDMESAVDRTVNSASIMAVGAARIVAYPEITETVLDEERVLFVPWHAHQKEIASYLSTKYPDEQSRKDTFVFGHVALSGASTNVSGHIYQGTELTAGSFKGFPFTFLGHFHKHATYGENDEIVYVGSPVQHSFSEAGDNAKGYILCKPSLRTWSLVRNPHAEQFVRMSVTEAQNVVKEATASGSLAGKIVHITGTAGVERKVINSLRKDLVEFARASGVAPARELAFPSLINSTRKEIEEKKQATGLEILDYVREYVGNRNDWKAEDADDGTAMIQYVQEKGEQLRREGIEDGNAGGGSGAGNTFIADVAELHMENFLGMLGKRAVSFKDLSPGVWLIQGKNGAGKTSLIEAVVWCLYGVCTRGENVGKKNVVNQVVHLDSAGCLVEVVFANGLQVRRARTKAGKSKLSYRQGNGQRVEKGNVKETQSMLERILNVDFTTFVSTVLLNANATQTFFSATEDRKKIIDDLLGFAVLERYATAMSADNTRVNVGIKSCDLSIREFTGKLDILQDIVSRKGKELSAKSVELQGIGTLCSEKEQSVKLLEAKVTEETDRLTLCNSAIIVAEVKYEDAVECNSAAQKALELRLDECVASRQAVLRERVQELQRDLDNLRSVRNSDSEGLAKQRVRDQFSLELSRVEADLKSATSALELRLDLETKHKQTELELEESLKALDVAKCMADAGTKRSQLAALVDDDTSRELARYTTCYRKLRDELQSVKDLKKKTDQYKAELHQYQEQLAAKDVMMEASQHIDGVVTRLEDDLDEGSNLRNIVLPSLGTASTLLRNFVNRKTAAPFETKAVDVDDILDADGDAVANSNTYQNLVTKYEESVLRCEDVLRSEEELAADEGIARERVQRCEERLATAVTERESANSAQVDLAASLRLGESAWIKIQTTHDMLVEQLSLGEFTDDLRNQVTVLSLRVKHLQQRLDDAADGNTGNDGKQSPHQDRVKHLEAEITQLVREAADVVGLKASCREDVISSENKVVACKSRMLLIKQEVNSLREQREEILHKTLSQARLRLHESTCELSRLHERKENVSADMCRRSQELVQLDTDCASRRAELVETQKELDALSRESKVITRWLKVWKGKGPGSDLATSFRSFCLERNLSTINDRLNVNIDILNRDSNDTWGQVLTCQLDNELRLVETGSGLSYFRLSEGQRKRIQLGLFLSIFEIAQNRSAFQPRILYLDEIFDALDKDGQIAVQRWITAYAENHKDLKVFVISHSATVDGFKRNIAGQIDVRYGPNGSEYVIAPV